MRWGCLVAIATLVSGCTELATCVRDDSCASGLRCGDDCYAAPAPDAGPICASDEDCDDGLFCDGVERCDPEDPGADARGCVPSARPCARCDEDTDTCEDCADLDGDGHPDLACGGDDCDDADPLRFPGNVEVCDVDGRDEDCDPNTYGVRDADGDASPDAACCNGTACGTDCDDARPDVRPTAPEICDGLDNDCDGAVDEERVVVDWYPDLDGDLFGDADADPVPSCAPLPDHAPNDRDCDDGAFATRPGATEACDGADQDCDDTIDEGAAATFYPDADRDGFGVEEGAMVGCVEDLPEGYALRAGDCVDDRDGGYVPSFYYPGAPELCDGRVNDCLRWDASDTAPPRSEIEDADGDGFASGDAPCFRGPFELDCADHDRNAHPGQESLFERPYCPTGGPVCFVPGSIGWVCGDPRADNDNCATFPGSAPRASHDYDCDGEVTRVREMNTCVCTPAGTCGEPFFFSVVSRSEGPVFLEEDPECGAAVDWRTCAGDCEVSRPTCAADDEPWSDGDRHYVACR